jgi:arylsulfatase A-like enzyme
VRSAPESLLLVTVDCLRADHCGFLGCSRGATPFLDSLANQSFVFTNAIASGVPTYYSLPALIASRYPLALGRDVIGIAEEESTLASEFHERGFETAAFIAANPYICSAFGYDHGFDTFRDFLVAPDARVEQRGNHFRNRANRALARACHSISPLGAAYDELYFRYCQKVSGANNESLDSMRQFPAADVIVDCAIEWVKANRGRRFVMWLHFMDPHAPYYPKADAARSMAGREITAGEARYLNSYWARGDLTRERLRPMVSDIQALYDAGILTVDSQLSRLKAAIADIGAWESCVVAVTADHGEEFLDHGGRFHAPCKLTDELIRVPLLVRVPGCSQRRAITDPFGVIDLSPTLLDVFDITAPASFRGKSCWQKILKREPWSSPVFTECAFGCTNPFERQTRTAPRLLSVRQGKYKLVVNFSLGTDQLFDLNSDPGEIQPLPETSAIEVRKTLLECARRHIALSSRSRDFDLRLAAQVSELRQEWSHAVRAN